MSEISPVPVVAAAPADHVPGEKVPYVPPAASTVFLGGIFILMALSACIVAGEIILPILGAFFIKLGLYPIMRGFERMHVPRLAASLLVIIMLLGTGIGIGTAVITPAMEWTQDLPREFPKLKERLHDMRNPIAPLQKVLRDAQSLTVDSDVKTGAKVVAVQQETVGDRMMTSVQNAAMGLGTMLVVLFFFLMSGDTFLRRLVEILPKFRDKKHAISISNQIEADISAYLLTITCMNLAVGTVAGLAMYFCGIGDPILWGIIAFLLNYVPIIGAIIGVGLFSMVGIVTEPVLSAALLPAAFYLAAHVMESQFVTPFLLARRFTINPVLVMVGLVFFYWMWGIPGAILATPMLAMMKVVCDNVDSLKPFGHFIEG